MTILFGKECFRSQGHLAVRDPHKLVNRIRFPALHPAQKYMPKTYSKAPDECTDRVAHLLKIFHPQLRDVGLKIDLLSVSTDKLESPLKLNGYPCAAIVRVVDVKGRTMGRGDAEIVIDEAMYLKMPDDHKDALLDHELYHIALKFDKHGVLKRDERGRPKIGMKKHDYQFGWFAEIAQRHGVASMEVKQATKLFLAEKQTLFAFVDNVKALAAPQ